MQDESITILKGESRGGRGGGDIKMLPFQFLLGPYRLEMTTVIVIFTGWLTKFNVLRHVQSNWLQILCNKVHLKHFFKKFGGGEREEWIDDCTPHYVLAESSA